MLDQSNGRPCQRCGDVLPEHAGPGRPRKYCPACTTPDKRNVQKGKGCMVDDCDQPAFARNWCKHHYGQWRRHGDPLWQPTRKAMVEGTCDQCSASFIYMPYPSRPVHRFCTLQCGNTWRAQRQRPGLRRQRQWAASWECQRRAEDRRELRTWKPKVWPHCKLTRRPEPRVFISRVCVACDAMWVSYETMPDTRYCSPCNDKRWKADGRHKRRAWKAAAAVRDVISPDQVFSRDGYRCQLCGVKTTGTFPAANSPTVDHIIPLAAGGEHSYANVQCACFACNCRKGAGAANDQLRLAV